jgi:hypothetical protein
MADGDQDAARAAVREHFQAERARLAAVGDDEWATRRAEEIRVVQEWAAAHRRSAA